MIGVLNELKTTTQILLKTLQERDIEKAQEAISVLLMQGSNLLGQEHPAMKQFFSVWNKIEEHITSGYIDSAQRQTNL